MSRRKRSTESAPADVAGQIRRLTVDEERPSREDRGFGQTIFTRPPVPLPRVLTAGRLARWRERRVDRRALRRQRRGRGKGDFQDAARTAEGDAWSRFYHR